MLLMLNCRVCKLRSLIITTMTWQCRLLMVVMLLLLSLHRLWMLVSIRFRVQLTSLVSWCRVVWIMLIHLFYHKVIKTNLIIVIRLIQSWCSLRLFRTQFRMDSLRLVISLSAIIVLHSRPLLLTLRELLTRLTIIGIWSSKQLFNSSGMRSVVLTRQTLLFLVWKVLLQQLQRLLKHY